MQTSIIEKSIAILDVLGGANGPLGIVNLTICDRVGADYWPLAS